MFNCQNFVSLQPNNSPITRDYLLLLSFLFSLPFCYFVEKGSNRVNSADTCTITVKWYKQELNGSNTEIRKKTFKITNPQKIVQQPYICSPTVSVMLLPTEEDNKHQDKLKTWSIKKIKISLLNE